MYVIKLCTCWFTANTNLPPTGSFFFFLDQAETLQRQHHRTLVQLQAQRGSALGPGLPAAMGKLLIPSNKRS